MQKRAFPYRRSTGTASRLHNRGQSLLDLSGKAYLSDGVHLYSSLFAADLYARLGPSERLQIPN